MSDTTSLDAQTDHLIELRGVYDGWSVRVLKDGTRVNRWIDAATGLPYPGAEWRAKTVAAYLAGEEPLGRWF
jgi:hypothetical protein